MAEKKITSVKGEADKDKVVKSTASEDKPVRAKSSTAKSDSQEIVEKTEAPKEEGKKASKEKEEPVWRPSKENKGKATQYRIFAALSWLAAIGAQVANIIYLRQNGSDIKLWIPLLIIAVDAAFAVLGGFLWKRSNQMDPPSEKNKFLFFMQSQLGMIVAIVAFLPLVVFVFFNKDMDGKQKGIIGGVAVIAMILVGVAGADFNPPSQEKYAAQAQVVKTLTDQDLVYGTKSGEKYHLYADCQYLKSDNVKELFEGSVEDLHAKNHKIGTGEDALCSACKKRALKAKNWTEDDLNNAVAEANEAKESEAKK